MSEHIFSTRPTDSWPVNERANILAETILPAVWTVSCEVFTQDDFCNAATVLDVSCGRGGLGLASRKMGARSRYIGIDTYDYESNGETPTAYQEYEAVRVESIRSKSCLSWLQNWSFDLVIAICTHPDVYEYVAKYVEVLPINLGGRVIFISEVSLDGCEKRGFWRGIGKDYGYQIGVYQKG